MKVKVAGLIVLFASLTISLYAQPIPVELMSGHKFTSVDVSLSKSFTKDSRLGFFHMNTLVIDYNDKSENSFILQDLLTYQLVKNLKIVGGAFYGMPGFNTTVGFQYYYPGKNFSLLFAPRINITEEPSYDFMTILQYKTGISDNTKLVTRLKLLNLFDANQHIKSYQWLRVGLEMKGTQFGLAFDFDEYGPDPSVQYNFGLFIRREIF